VAEFLREPLPAEITEELAAELAAAYPAISRRALRHALHECGIPLAPLVEGVRQSSFDDLERTLNALERIYEAAAAPRRREVRALVIEAKQHAFLASRNPKVESAHRLEKEEMVLWMRTWLENPPLFPAWVSLRRRLHSSVPGKADS
jgi:hypothetical protein